MGEISGEKSRHSIPACPGPRRMGRAEGEPGTHAFSVSVGCGGGGEGGRRVDRIFEHHGVEVMAQKVGRKGFLYISSPATKIYY